MLTSSSSLLGRPVARSEFPGRLFGVVEGVEPAADGVTLVAAVRVGPNPHEVQHVCTEFLVPLGGPSGPPLSGSSPLVVPPKGRPPALSPANELNNRRRDAWIRALVARPVWDLEVAANDIDETVPAASPHDPTWMFWYAPRLGPTACLAVFLLHHASINVTSIDLRRLAEAVGCPPRGGYVGPHHPLPSALHRAGRAGLLEADADSATLRLFSPVPRRARPVSIEGLRNV